MLDVLIVNPGNQQEVYQYLSVNITAKEPPLWGRLIASYLLKKGASTEILDAETLGRTPYEITGEANLLKPRLIILLAHGHQPSASTQKMSSVIATSKMLKSYLPSIPVLIVGGHPAALPGRTLQETGADAVCTGEGPITTLQFLHLLDDQPTKWKWLLKDVDGLCYWDHDETVRSNPAANVADLGGEMPGGGWDLLPMNLYRAHIWHCLQEDSRKPYASIATSLGCSFACDFCMIQSQFREGDVLRLKGKANSYRMWPAEIIGTEIETLVEKYGVRNIKITDEMFWLNRNHVSQICDQILMRDYGDKTNFWFYSRVDTIKDDDALLEKARRAGMKWAALGIEALSDEVRNGVDKADYGMVDIFKVVNKLRSHEINVIGNYIFGLPGDTAESMQQTLDLALELQTEFANFYCAVAFPGSPLYVRLTANGWKPPSWSAYSFHSYDHEPLSTETLSSTDILEFQEKAHRTYFTDSNYLAMIRRKFGDTAVEQIKAMTAKRLPRRLLDEREFRCA